MTSLSYLLVLLAICRNSQCKSSTASVEYYWPSFNGKVPKNAYVAGKYKGKPIYVGMVPIGDQGTIVGQLSESNKIIVTTSPSRKHRSPVYTETENIRILCSAHPEHLCWADSKEGENREGLPGDCVKGGREISRKTNTFFPLGVARTQRNGNDLLGKSAPWPKTFGKMYYAYGGNAEKKSSGYQTLIYSTKCACKGDNSTDSTPSSNIHCTKKRK